MSSVTWRTPSVSACSSLYQRAIRSFGPATEPPMVPSDLTAADARSTPLSADTTLESAGGLPVGYPSVHGPYTVMCADARTAGTLVALAVAVLLYVRALPLLLALLTCTESRAWIGMLAS